MNIFLGTEHLKTLHDLQEIAEKHNCKIHFGVRYNYENDLDTDILLNCGVDKGIVEILDKPFNYNISIKDIKNSTGVFWFELYDKGKDISHTMNYCECNCSFKIETDYDYEENEVIENFIEKHRNEYCDYDEDFFRFTSSPTIITGFGYKAKHIDSCCYREGMAVKYFGDLVCKYLKEPMIERVY